MFVAVSRTCLVISRGMKQFKVWTLVGIAGKGYANETIKSGEDNVEMWMVRSCFTKCSGIHLWKRILSRLNFILK